MATDVDFTRRILLGSMLIVFAMLVALWFLLRLARYSHGEQRESVDGGGGSRPAQPGCPVAFTASQDFKGDKMCFGVGRYHRDPASSPTAKFFFEDDAEHPDIDADNMKLSTIASYQVRVGYVLEAYEDEDFGGKRIIRAVGPAKQVLREGRELAFPGSMRVSFA